MSRPSASRPTSDDIFERRGSHGAYPSIADRIDATGDCWEWTGVQNSNGYGQVGVRGKTWGVHRFIWEALIGPIPDDLQIDHLCRNKVCVNPDHLEPVTGLMNVQRGTASAVARRQQLQKTHCPNGHPYSGDNLYVRPSGWRDCRICKRNGKRAWRNR